MGLETRERGTGAPAVLHDPAELRNALDAERAKGRSVGFVPTMGALHEGHLALVRHAASVCDIVAVSIFVNPSQFGPGEDLERYPRNLEADLRTLANARVDYVFAPSVEAVYPAGHSTIVHVEGPARGLCGPFRPGHFDGVATVVTKLFSMVGPCTAVFGRKDYQQLRVIERMTADLNLPVTVVGLPTVREPDGLAMSSRNAYLSESERLRARAVVDGLRAAARAWAAHERESEALRQLVLAQLAGRVDRVDYVFVGDPATLETFPAAVPRDRTALVAVAVHVGRTRLIDNIELGVDDVPSRAPS